jgi:hypothetical protein
MGLRVRGIADAPYHATRGFEMDQVLYALAGLVAAKPTEEELKWVVMQINTLTKRIMEAENADGFSNEEMQLMRDGKKVLAVKAYMKRKNVSLIDAHPKVREYMVLNGWLT